MINMTLYMRKHRAERRKNALRRLGGRCIKCGSTSNLQFDHIDAKNKKFGIANMFAHSQAKLDAELDKCQLLCFPCHNIKTLEDNGWKNAKTEHGTPRSYLYCHCAICRKVNSERVARWRKKSGRH